MKPTKKFSKIIILLIIILTSLKGYAQFRNQLNLMPCSYSYVDVVRADSNTMFFTGSNSLTLSITAGMSYRGMSYGGMFSSAASYPSLNFGIAVGNSGAYRVNKGCGGYNDWTSTYSVGVSTDLLDVHFTNEQNGYVCGTSGVLVRTTNQGKNWTKITTNTTTSLNGLDCPNDTMAFVCGNKGLILNAVKSSVVDTQAICKANLNKIAFTSRLIGWVVGDSGSVYKTTDGSKTWTSVKLDTKAKLNNLTFFTPNHGVIVGDSSKIYVTFDAGVTWQKSTNQTVGKILAVAFRNDQEGYCTGNKIALKTTDGGLTWTNENLVINQICFMTPKIGYAISANSPTYKTTDGGRTWQIITNFPSLSNMCILNKDTAYGVNGTTTIYRTTDGWKTWTTISNPAYCGIRGIYFTDYNNGTTVGDYTTYMHTSNGGKSWSLKTVNNSMTMNNVYYHDLTFPSPTIGYFLTSGGCVFKTTDGGSSWYNYYASSSTYGLMHAAFTDVNTGWVTGRDGALFHTSDGGKTWAKQTTGITSDVLTGIYFFNKDSGIVVGPEDYMLTTTNGGATWVKKTSGTSCFLNNICFSDPEHCYAQGYDFESNFNIFTIQPYSNANFGFGVCPGESISFTTTTPTYLKRKKTKAVYELTTKDDNFSNSIILDSFDVDSTGTINAKIPYDMKDGVYKTRIRDISDTSRTSLNSYLRVLKGNNINIIRKDSFLIAQMSDTTVIPKWYYLSPSSSYYQYQLTSNTIKATKKGSYYAIAEINCCDIISPIMHLDSCNGSLRTLNSSTTKSICVGDSVIVGKNVYKQQGIYTDTLKNEYNCDSIVTTTITYKPSPAKPYLTHTGNFITCNLNGMANYNWYYNNVQQSELNNTCEYKDGTWNLVVLNSEGCLTSSDTYKYSTIVTDDKPTLGSTRIGIYPNPNDGNLTISLDKTITGKIQVTVYDLQGNSIFLKTIELKLGQTNLSLALTSIVSGNYILQVKTKDKTYNTKILIKK